MSLTIVYLTNRRDSRIQWFFDSLRRQAGEDILKIKIVVIDFYGPKPKDEAWPGEVVWTTPKPTPWQGAYRLTQRDYFAASNARNTALCHASDGWVAFMDDLSVLTPGWMDRVYTAMKRKKTITLGTYRKVKNLVVEDGVVKSFDDFPPGNDTRFDSERADVFPVTGGWAYGHVVGPVDAFLDINGYDESADSMSGEDTAAGIMLEKKGCKLVFDQKMLVLESEEMHHVEPSFLRIIKPQIPGISRFTEKDASWAHLNRVNAGDGWALNSFNLRELRQHILTGGAFPTNVGPATHWPDGQPLSEM